MNDQQILEIFAKLTSPSYYGKGKNYMRLKWAMSAALTNPLFNELQDAGVRIQRIDNARASGVNIWLPLAWYESIKRSSGGKIKWKAMTKPKQQPVCENWLFQSGIEGITSAYVHAIYQLKCNCNRNKAIRELEMIAGESDEFDGKIGQMIYREIIAKIEQRYKTRLGLKRKGLIK